jgi:hypothetical protein
MHYAPFSDYFPSLALTETRTIHIPENHASELPAADYSFLEMFCAEKGCDCRRVFFYVISSLMSANKPAAVIAYGWESKRFYAKWMGTNDPQIIRELAGPSLNLGSPQTHLARPLLKLTKSVLLKDPEYITRVKRHYRMFKDHLNTQRP